MKVLGIDAGEALAMPGVVAVMTAADVPGERHQGHIIHDWPAMIAVGGSDSPRSKEVAR